MLLQVLASEFMFLNHVCTMRRSSSFVGLVFQCTFHYHLSVFFFSSLGVLLHSANALMCPDTIEPKNTIHWIVFCLLIRQCFLVNQVEEFTLLAIFPSRGRQKSRWLPVDFGESSSLNLGGNVSDVTVLRTDFGSHSTFEAHHEFGAWYIYIYLYLLYIVPC